MNMMEHIEAAAQQEQETFVADVRQFTEAVGCTTDQFNVRQTALYLGLMAEEFAEVLEALSLPLHAKSLHHISNQFKTGRLDGAVLATNQRVELLDGCTDLAWVTIGAMLSQGVDVLGAMREVARSNMSKLIEAPDGTPLAVKDINGKVVKPASFSGPDLTPFIAKQGD